MLRNKSEVISKRSSTNGHNKAKSQLPLLPGSASTKVLPVQKLLQLYPSALSSYRISNFENSSTGNIGPGHYNYVSSTLGGPGFVFSSTSRFPQCFSQAISPIHKEVTNFTEKNTNMAPFFPQNRASLIKVKAKIQENQIKNTQERKKKICLETKKNKIKKIKEKFHKFQMKIEFHQVKNIGNAWLTLISAISVTNLASIKFEKKRIIRKGSKKLLKFLFNLCKFVGKCQIIVKKIRFQKAKHKLTALVRRGKVWVKKKQSNYSKILNDIIANAATRDIIFRLMYQWRNCLVFIQRKMKKCLFEKKIGMALKLLQWGKIEKNLAELKKQTKLGSKSRFQSLIPLVLKENIIKSKLKERIRDYCAKLKDYKIQINEILSKSEYKGQKALRKNKQFNEAVLPNKPKPIYDFSKKDYMKMIKHAMNIKRKSQLIN